MRAIARSTHATKSSLIATPSRGRAISHAAVFEVRTIRRGARATGDPGSLARISDSLARTDVRPRLTAGRDSRRGTPRDARSATRSQGVSAGGREGALWNATPHAVFISRGARERKAVATGDERERACCRFRRRDGEDVVLERRDRVAFFE